MAAGDIIGSIKSNFITHILLAYILLISGFTVNFIQLLTVPLWYLGYKGLYRTCIINLNYLIWCLIPGAAQWWADADIYIHGRPEDFDMLGKENSIAVLNHRAELDWIVSWVVAEYCNILGNAKCIAKNVLRYIPVIGWAFWFSEYIFLKRKIEEDRKRLNAGFENLSSFEQPFWLLIFCEGTRFTPDKQKTSNEFAVKNGLRPLKHHLVPRTKGFTLITQGLRESVDMLYDATVCFRGDAENLSVRDLLKGKRFTADFLVRRVSLDEVPIADDECGQYVHDMYLEKDELCEYHMNHDNFPSGVANTKYEKFISKKIPKNYWSLFFSIFWAIVCTVPLAYLTFLTLVFGSWTQTAIFSACVLTVILAYNVMLAATKPRSSYGS